MAAFFSSPEYSAFVSATDGFLELHFKRRETRIGYFSPQLTESMRYSLFNGGKRFRPVLALCTAHGLGISPEQAVAWGAALEMVHTYSLIHDDLPCMDNDDERRGQPTNHKKFGEPLALLAGDALLTESFLVLAENYSDKPHMHKLVALLGTAAGASGMVGGQAMDMGLGQPLNDLAQVQKMHGGKTGALIAAAVEGAGYIANADEFMQYQLKQLGQLIGLAFQIKDDLLDREDDARSYLHYGGVDSTEKQLLEAHRRALHVISQLPRGCHFLEKFISANAEREK